MPRGKAVEVINVCLPSLQPDPFFVAARAILTLLSRFSGFRRIGHWSTSLVLFAGCARAVGLDIQVIEFYFLVCCCMRIQFWFAVRSILTRFASYFRCAVY